MARYQAREPLYANRCVDFSVAFWRDQPRDHFGRWTDDPADTARREAIAAANKGASLKLVGASYRQTTVKSPSGTLTLTESRKVYRLDHEQRESLIQAAGLRSASKYHGVDDPDLIHRAVEHPEERGDIEAELAVRQKANLAALQTLKAGLAIAKQDQRKPAVDKLDAHLRKTKLGRALIAIRTSLASDRAAAAEGRAKETTADKAKEYLHELATGRLIKVLASSVAGLAAHMLSTDPELPEKIRHITELQPVEAGLVVLVGAAVSLATASLKKHGGKVAKKAVEKVKLKGTVA